MVILVMGVAGAGKTTLGRALAERWGWPFFDADDLHPAANVAKMARGEPLDDDDRVPWLLAVRAQIDRWIAEGRSGVLACSALRRSYRDVLGVGRPEIHLVHLYGEPALLAARLRWREGHFMPAALLASQLATLEPPDDAIAVAIALPISEQVEAVEAALGLVPKG
ncbi:MAG: gluconokinase [Thermoanaerobaculia bacterium]|nr:gluconokinase [Thermoanaerobaculia bacterium]